MKDISLDHINMNVKNFSKSADFYFRIFGFEAVEGGVDAQGSPWCILKNGEHMLCIYEEPEAELPSEDAKFLRIYHFGIRVRDPEVWEAKVKNENLNLLYGGSIRYPHSTSWYIADPSGHEIEVSYWDKDNVTFK